jgi:hypothetical protein
VRFVQQVNDVVLVAGEEIVQTKYVVSVFDQPLAQVGTEEASTAGYQNPFFLGAREGLTFLSSEVRSVFCGQVIQTTEHVPGFDNGPMSSYAPFLFSRFHELPEISR